MVLYCHIHCLQHKENWHFAVVKYDGLTLEKLILTCHASQLHHPSLPPTFVRVYGSLVCRLSCVGGGKEPVTQRLRMLSSPRISGNFGNFRKICFVALISMRHAHVKEPATDHSPWGWRRSNKGNKLLAHRNDSCVCPFQVNSTACDWCNLTLWSLPIVLNEAMQTATINAILLLTSKLRKVSHRQHNSVVWPFRR